TSGHCDGLPHPASLLRRGTHSPSTHGKQASPPVHSGCASIYGQSKPLFQSEPDSSMTPRTIHWWRNFLLCNDFPSNLGRITIRLPGQIGNQLCRTNICGRVAMTLPTPSHGERFNLLDFNHLIDPSMAGNTTDSGTHMR